MKSTLLLQVMILKTFEWSLQAPSCDIYVKILQELYLIFPPKKSLILKNMDATIAMILIISKNSKKLFFLGGRYIELQ